MYENTIIITKSYINFILLKTKLWAYLVYVLNCNFYFEKVVSAGLPFLMWIVCYLL